MAIDLSFTSDLDWIKKREESWKPIQSLLKQHLRKKELEPIYRYFMTGELDPDNDLGELAHFDWFPLQNAAAWDYLFQHVIQNPSVYQEKFYFQFSDLSERALSAEEELEMWDYFAGSSFQPAVTSRVPIGEEGKPFSFVVEQGDVIANLSMWLEGMPGYKQDETSKFTLRLNYFLSLFPHIGDENFKRKTKYSDYETRTGRLIKGLFKFLFKPVFIENFQSDSVWVEKRLKYLEQLREMLESVNMQPAMRELWEETKAKYGAK